MEKSACNDCSSEILRCCLVYSRHCFFQKYFLNTWWLNEQANKTFPLVSAQFNGFLGCYFPAIPRKLGSTVALSYWMSQKDKTTFRERMFINVLTQLTLISEPIFSLLSLCFLFLKKKYVIAFLGNKC